MREKSKAIGEYSAKAPQTEADLRSSLFGSDQTLGSLRENEADKIKELYNHDKTIASNYQPPEGFLEDPGAKAQFGSDVIARQGGELADIQKGIANRRDVLGESLEKGLKIFLMGLDALKYEQSGLQDQFNNEIKLKELTDKATERAITRGDKSKTDTRQKQNDLDADGKSFGQMIDNKVMTWTQAWNELARRYPEFVKPDGTSDAIDATLGGSAKVTGYKEGQPTRTPTGRATPEYKKADTSEGIAEKKQRVAKEAYEAKQKGSSIKEIESYIASQGLDPADKEFDYIMTEEQKSFKWPWQ